MAKDKELDQVPDGEPVENTDLSNSNSNSDSGGSHGFLPFSELTIWVVGVAVFIVPFLIVILKNRDWNGTFSEMDLFLTYVGFLVPPLCATFTRIKKKGIRDSFFLIIFILAILFMSLYCVFSGEKIDYGLMVFNSISFFLTIAISLAVYITILILEDKKKDKKKTS